MNKLKLLLAIFTGKLLSILLPVLGRNATSLPGYISLRIYKNILENYLEQALKQCILITGTNGKSTTAGLVSEILKANNISYLHNLSGANLQSGILTVLLKNSTWTGKLNKEFSLLEVDEATLQYITNKYPAQNLLVSNFFRDQLDRFGEIEQTIELVQTGINISNTGNLIINADDPNVCHLINNNTMSNTIYYGIDYNAINKLKTPETQNKPSLTAEFAFCPQCNSELDYTHKWLAQLGNYSCNNCDYAKPTLQVQIIKLQLTSTGSEFTVQYPDNSTYIYTLKLPGLFNIYNALGAITCAYVQGLSSESIQQGLDNYQSLFGRSQKVIYKNRELNIFLIKNPIGATEIIKLITLDPNARLLVAINDNYADGRDISWLWDADFELLKQTQQESTIYTAGTRGTDMAVRLKYTGLDNIQNIDNLQESIDTIINNTREQENIYIMPTYTALIELTKILDIEY